MSDSPRWITTSKAARLLGVNARAVQKRAARGSLPARKVGERWEINADALDASNGPKVDASIPPIIPQVDASDVQSVPKVDASKGVNGRVHVDAVDASIGREVEIELRAQLDREREFSGILKAQLEAVTQSEAQTKAALREALRAMPKALAPGDAPASANGAPQRAPTGAADTDSPTTANGSQRPTGAVITYDSIADEIEAMMELKP
jgi:excisionase family DNA binding protein